MHLLRVLYMRNLLEVLEQKPESTSLEEGRMSKVKLLKFLRVLVKVKSRGKNTPFARWEDTRIHIQKSQGNLHVLACCLSNNSKRSDEILWNIKKKKKKSSQHTHQFPLSNL